MTQYLKTTNRLILNLQFEVDGHLKEVVVGESEEGGHAVEELIRHSAELVDRVAHWANELAQRRSV